VDCSGRFGLGTKPSLESVPQAPAYKFKIDVTRDGVAAGISRRSVRQAPGHGNHVEHVTLYLKKESKGRGFGTAYWDACLARYADLALHRVVITADEDWTAVLGAPPRSLRASRDTTSHPAEPGEVVASRRT
jgi:hypothetical protein